MFSPGRAINQGQPTQQHDGKPPFLKDPSVYQKSPREKQAVKCPVWVCNRRKQGQVKSKPGVAPERGVWTHAQSVPEPESSDSRTPTTSKHTVSQGRKGLEKKFQLAKDPLEWWVCLELTGNNYLLNWLIFCLIWKEGAVLRQKPDWTKQQKLAFLAWLSFED